MILLEYFCAKKESHRTKKCKYIQEMIEIIFKICSIY
jgi:hypothetical protein